jgi:type I restriction-modification system DNA methylase subunit
MSKKAEFGPDNHHPLSRLRTDLGDGNYDTCGNRREVDLRSRERHVMATKQKPSVNTASTGTGHRDLLRELWNAAVALRGTIETPDYKRYILPLIFLRFLSLRFEKRRAELEDLIANPKSDYHCTDPQIRESVLEDPDEYRAVGAFIVPKGARWSDIRNQAQEDDIKVRLDNILELLEKTYPDQLRGLLPRIYADSNMQRDDLAGLINLFSKDVFKQDHGGEDLIGKVYEYFIGEFASSEGKRGGEYFTPASIVRTLVAMLEPTEGVVFDPCCGSGGMFVQSDVFTKHSGRLSFVGQEAKEFTYRLSSSTASTAISNPATLTPMTSTHRSALTTSSRIHRSTTARTAKEDGARTACQRKTLGSP